MTLTNQSRKRRCDDTDPFDLAIPVTKRMNNLHIDSEIGKETVHTPHVPINVHPLNAHQLSSDMCFENEMNSKTCDIKSNTFNNSHSMVCDDHWHCDSTNYTPELDNKQNPIYYESNKLLFEAHRLRIQRSLTNKCLCNKI